MFSHRQGSNRLCFSSFSSSCLDFNKQSKVKNKNNKIKKKKDELNYEAQITWGKQQKSISCQNLRRSASYTFPKENWLLEKVTQKKQYLSWEGNMSTNWKKWKEAALVSKRVHSAGFKLQHHLDSHHPHCYGLLKGHLPTHLLLWVESHQTVSLEPISKGGGIV